MFGHYTYLVFELVWALPVVLAQVFIGRRVLCRALPLLLVGTLAPTVYFSAADAVAIHNHIWTLNPARIVGLRLGALPLEEAIFFLVTNTMIVQGLLLFTDAELRTQARGLTQRVGRRRVAEGRGRG